MIATLASYDRMFGPIHTQTLALARLVGERLAESGEQELARLLLERVARDVVRAGGATHPLRRAALVSLRNLHLECHDLGAAIAVQNELANCWLMLEGPDAPETLEARSCLGSLIMQSASVSEA